MYSGVSTVATAILLKMEILLMKTELNMELTMSHSLLKKILFICLFASQSAWAEQIVKFKPSSPTGANGVVLTLNEDGSFKQLTSEISIDIPKNLPASFYRSNIMLAEEMAINEIAFWLSRHLDPGDCQKSNSSSFSREDIYSITGSGQQYAQSQALRKGFGTMCKYSNEGGLNLAGVQKLSEEGYSINGNDFVKVVVGISATTVNAARGASNLFNNPSPVKPRALPENSIGNYKWTNPGAF
jgi:hypothetical protein